MSQSPKTINLQSTKHLLLVVICGILLTLATGLIENTPEVGVPEYKFYGYPLVWRVESMSQWTGYIISNLIIDILFWVAVCFVAYIIITKVLLRPVGDNSNLHLLFLSAVLFIPLGFIMDLIHEFGHALWGIALGGRLVYIQVTYFELYPKIAITSKFQLGYVVVAGLSSQFKLGLFLLAGSMTTNIASWLIVIILLKKQLGLRTKMAFLIAGLIGLLDLPFYVIFPQIDLRHWIVLGGSTPEPLVGARLMGVSDLVFYFIVLLDTILLSLFYFKILSKQEKY